MTDVVTIALITGMVTVLPSTLTAIFGFMNSAAIRRMERHSLATKNAIVTLEQNTNSIKDALVKVTGEAEHAKGKLEGAAAAEKSLPPIVRRQENEGR
jgi:hypothetical protein